MNIIITGGHSGMGLELSRKLLAGKHRIGLIVRSEKRREETAKLFASDAPVEIFTADLSKRNEIEAVASEIASHWESVDGLFNNAGVLLDQLYYSDYGNELQLEVNAISPYLLTQALLPLLKKAANPFVVSTATAGLNNKKAINIPEFKKPQKFTKLMGSYMDSKLMLVVLMNFLSTQHENIRFVHVNPGAIKTKMTSGSGMPFFLRPIRNLLFKSPAFGANNLYKGAFETQQTGSGIYLSGGQPKDMKVRISQKEIDQLLANS